MGRGSRILLGAACALVVGLLSVPDAGAADENDQGPVYNPYPPDILPDDLRSEMRRVEREIGRIFKQAVKEWKALPPPNKIAQEFHGSPLTLQGTGYDAVRILGKLMNYDLNMSVERDVACASCHMPYAAFSGPMPSVNLTTIAYPGSFDFRFGKRTPQRYTYSPGSLCFSTMR
jgi:cytochrome c peroxidase